MYLHGVARDASMQRVRTDERDDVCCVRCLLRMATRDQGKAVLSRTIKAALD